MIEAEGEVILIEVVAIDRYRVRLGITAPESIPVNREEIYNDMKRIRRNP